MLDLCVTSFRHSLSPCAVVRYHAAIHIKRFTRAKESEQCSFSIKINEVLRLNK